MLTASHASCLPRVIAIYVVVYPIISRLQWLANWWTGTVEFSHPIPSSITTTAVYIVNIILVLWLLLSYFVWRSRMWARWSIAYSALILGIAQCFLYRDMFRLYASAGLVSEMLLEVIPSLFLSAILFCPVAGQCFDMTNASNHSLQPTAGRSDE
jgi:hypothetical protein